MTKKIKQLIKEGNSIIFDPANENELMRVYVSTSLFDRNKAFRDEDRISTIGTLVFEMTNNTKIAKGQEGVFHTIVLPVNVQFNFSMESKFEGTLDNGEIPKDKYNVFTLTKGDVFIQSVAIEQKTTDIIDFVNMIHAGQVPASVPYDELLNIYLNVMEITGKSLASPAYILEIIMSELTRARSDNGQPYRLKIPAKGAYNKHGYEFTSMEKLPALNSTYAGLAFQDIDAAVLQGINRTAKNTPEKTTPLEKIAKY